MLKRKPQGTSPQNKHELKMAAIQAWQSITREETQQLVMPMNHRLQQSFHAKDMQQNTKHDYFHSRAVTLLCPKYYGALKWVDYV